MIIKYSCEILFQSKKIVRCGAPVLFTWLAIMKNNDVNLNEKLSVSLRFLRNGLNEALNILF